VTLGLYRNRSVEQIKGNQATFDNSQRNNLRSCVWVFGGNVFVRIFVPMSRSLEASSLLFLSSRALSEIR